MEEVERMKAILEAKDIDEDKSRTYLEWQFIMPCQSCCYSGCCPINCIYGEDLPDGGKATLKLNANAVRSLISQWLDRSWLSLSSVLLSSLSVDATTLGINLKCPGQYFPGDFV